MFVICLIISYKYTNNLPISQLFLCLSYPELTLIIIKNSNYLLCRLPTISSSGITQPIYYLWAYMKINRIQECLMLKLINIHSELAGILIPVMYVKNPIF